MRADDVVGDVAASVGLAEGAAGVRALVHVVGRLEPVAVRKLSRETDLPVPLVSAVCNELRKRGVVSPKRPVRLTRRGRELFPVARMLDVEAGCRACERREVVVPAAVGPVVRRIAALAREAPPHRVELDQVHCTVETKVRRALALHEAGLLDGRRIMCLGDDDLTSLAIALLAEHVGGEVGSLTVVDIDPAVVAFVDGRARRARLPVECLVHDLRDPLPERLRASADVVLVDPPYTRPGAALFLARAAEATGREPGRHVFLAFRASRAPSTLAVQRDIAQRGFVIRRVIRDFNRYVGAEVLGGTSHLYELVTTQETQPRLGRYDGPLYTAEVRAEPGY